MTVLALVALSIAPLNHEPPAAAANAPPATANTDRYPPGRDYLRERMLLIEQHADQNTKENSEENATAAWNSYLRVVTFAAGISDYAPAASAKYQALKASDSEGVLDITVAFAAAGGFAPDDPPGIAAAGAEIFNNLKETRFAEMSKSLADLTSFKPHPALTRPGISVLLPHLGSARAMARLNTARMGWAFREAAFEDADSILRANLTLASASSAEPSLIAHLVGVAIEALTVERLLDTHLRTPLPPEAARKAAAAIATSPRPDWSCSVNGERLMGLDSIDWLYTKGSLRDISPEMSKLEAAAARALWAKREDSLALYDTIFDHIVAAFDADPAKATHALDRLAEEEKKFGNPAHKARFSTTALLIPAMSRAVQVERSARTLREAAPAVLAISLYQSEHNGSLPTSLSDLVPKYIPALPIDWHSPTREPLRYRTIDAAPGYILYSVGRDQADDGGTPEARFPRLASAKGTDAVYSIPETLPETNR